MGAHRVSLAQFTGPLDLLLHLVRTNEMDIFDLDVALITEQYLAIIEREGVRDLASAYYFLAMAAWLVELKSRLLLPQPEKPPEAGEEKEAPDPRLELARRLAAYQDIRELTGELASRYEQVGRHWPRQIIERLEAEIVYSIDTLSVYDLMTAFATVLERPRFRQITIFKEDYDLDQARGWLLSRLQRGPTALLALLSEQQDVFSLLVTFIALLDLITDEQVGFTSTSDGVVLSLLSAKEPA